MLRQYLYSTRGEIALAGKEWEVLEWRFKRGLAEISLRRGEREAFEEARARAETRLKGSGREQLREWAARLRQAQRAFTPRPAA